MNSAAVIQAPAFTGKCCLCIRFNILYPCSWRKTWLFCVESKLLRFTLTFCHHLTRPMGQNWNVGQISHCTCSGTMHQLCVCVCVCVRERASERVLNQIFYYKKNAQFEKNLLC